MITAIDQAGNAWGTNGMPSHRHVGPMLPRRPKVSRAPVVAGPDRYELVLEEPVRRSTSAVNVRWEDKAVFDSIRTWLSYTRGRPVSQWDVFTFILATALENEGSELASAKLFVE